MNPTQSGRALVREQAAWNRQNLAQGRLRAFVSAWLDVRAASRV